MSRAARGKFLKRKQMEDPALYAEPWSLYEEEGGSHRSPPELEPSTSSPALYPTPATPPPVFLPNQLYSPQSSIATNALPHSPSFLLPSPPFLLPPPPFLLPPPPAPQLPNLAQEALDRLRAREGEPPAARDDGDFRPAKKKKKKEESKNGESAGEADEVRPFTHFPSSL